MHPRPRPTTQRPNTYMASLTLYPTRYAILTPVMRHPRNRYNRYTASGTTFGTTSHLLRCLILPSGQEDQNRFITRHVHQLLADGSWS